MTEYHDSASESVLRCGIAPKGWKLLRGSDKSWRFQITVYHTKTFGTQVTPLKIGIAIQVSDGRHLLETIKTISTPRKINAILLNIKSNGPNLVSMCGYILVINWQKLSRKYT